MNKNILIILFCCLWFPINMLAQENALWLRYSAISPDGQKIAFSYKGDLYVVNSKGGLATALTTHEAHDFMPVWSRDGKQIAFASDRYGNFDVFIIPSTGGEPTRLTYFSSDDTPSDFTPDGKSVIFSASRLDIASNAMFPSNTLSEMYSVPVAGGRERQMISMPMEMARYNADGSMLTFQDAKGYEDKWRKHHTSSVTRDIWVYDLKNNTHKKLSEFEGEDRNPVFSKDGKTIFYLSEQKGSFNVFQMEVANPSDTKAITNFTKHPVRFLTIADNGTLCFSYNGEIYTQTPNNQPTKIDIQVATDFKKNPEVITTLSNGATEMAVSPNGKEVVFIVRGEVFVTALEGNFTKRITNTPEQERSVSFSPDGKAILYASERNKSWNIYQTKLARKEETYFFNATILQEEVVLATDAEEFQPAYAPNGKEIVFLEERTTLKVINLESKKVRTILAGEKNYSYADGDQWYQWSPDSQWFLVNFLQDKQWISEVGLVAADGKSEVINLTQSGYNDEVPKWANEGKMLIWFSNRDGMKNQASWGSEQDVYAMYFTKDAFDKASLNKEEFELLKEKDDKKEEKKDDKKEDKDKKDKDKKEEIKPLVIELEDIDKRKRKLTIHSSRLADAVLSKDGEKMYYLARFEKGYDLWETNLRTRETKILVKLGANGVSLLEWDKKAENLFCLVDGAINKFNVASGKRDFVSFNAEMLLNKPKEREYMFEHIWRQVLKKFYVKDLHKVDWEFYKKEYARFLPHIHNNYDFAEMASELLGELNASHTGCFANNFMPNADNTASLGAFYDEDYRGEGLKIAEVIKKGALDKKDSKIKAGTIIEKIDNVVITSETNFYPLLNRKAGKYVLLSLYNENTKERWEETVKPISRGEQNELLYNRWVENNRKMVEKLSNGKIGYVHVRGMDDRSFRTIYEEILGKHYPKDAIIVDTRFNGGGWLHDDLVTFLSGKPYATFLPRGQNIGQEPQFKWNKPSVVLMSESNYSDAHIFPYAYKQLGIGKLVGMPVPGTGTAVWWENLLDNSLTFGIPQVANVSPDGKILENTQLEPDYKVVNEYNKILKGQDQQIEKAVELLLKK